MTPPTIGARITGPQLLEREAQSYVRIDLVSAAGEAIGATAATVEILDPAGVQVLAPTAATPDASGAYYAVPALTLPSSLTPATRWTCVWVGTAAGEAFTLRVPAALVLRRIFPVAGAYDLRARHPDVDRLLPRGGTWGTILGEAWVQVQTRIMADGRWPWLVVDPYSLREPHVLHALALLFAGAAAVAAGQGGRYAELAEYYRREIEACWKRLALEYATPDEELAVGTETGAPVWSLVDRS